METLAYSTNGIDRKRKALNRPKAVCLELFGIYQEGKTGMRRGKLFFDENNAKGARPNVCANYRTELEVAAHRISSFF